MSNKIISPLAEGRMLRAAFFNMSEERPHISINFLKTLAKQSRGDYRNEMKYVIAHSLAKRISSDDYITLTRNFVKNLCVEDLFDVDECLSAIENDFIYERTFEEVLYYLTDYLNNLEFKIRVNFSQWFSIN